MFTQPVNSNMSDFIIKKLPHDLSYHARLAFIGKYLRLVVARNRETACQQQQERKSRINELESLASAWVGKLDEQEQGAKKEAESSWTAVPRRVFITPFARPIWARLSCWI